LSDVPPERLTEFAFSFGQYPRLALELPPAPATVEVDLFEMASAR